MSPKASKSRNLDLYPYFFHYSEPSDIPYDILAKKLAIHPNRLRGMIRPARRNSTIYTALREEGYSDSQIPRWFARPVEPLAYRRAATAGLRPSAEKRSGAESRSKPKRGYTRHTIDVAQKRNAERPSALSESSAPPTIINRPVQLVYRRPPNPYLEEAHRLLRETIEDDMRSSLNLMKSRQTPRMPSLEGLIAIQKVYKNWQEIEDEKTAQTLFILNLLQILGTSKPFDIEEIKEFFTKPLKELKPTADDTEMNELIEALCDLLKKIPNKGPNLDQIQMTMTEIQKSRKSDREAIVELVKMFQKNRRKNWDLEMLMRRNREMIENFPNNIFKF